MPSGGGHDVEGFPRGIAMTETHDPIRFVTTGQPATETAAEMCEAIKAAV